MAYNTTWASAIELSGEARMAYEEWSSHAPLAAWFPTYSNPGLTFSFDRRDPEVTEVADYREYDAENTKGNGRVKTKIIGTLPPLGRDYRVEEYEQILLYEDGMKAESLRAKLIEYARFGGEAIGRRLERARISALLEGGVVLAENNVAADISYGRDPQLKETLTGADLWSAATSKPLAKLEDWINTVIKVSGVQPLYLLVSRDVLDALRVHKEIRDSAFAGAASLPDRVNLEQVTDALSAELGLVGIRDMTKAYTLGVDEAGNIFRLGLGNPWPNGTAVLVSSPGAGFGRTEFGIPAFALDSKFGISPGERTGIFAHAFDQDNVAGFWVGLNATALPTFPGVNEVFVAKVL